MVPPGDTPLKGINWRGLHGWDQFWSPGRHPRGDHLERTTCRGPPWIRPYRGDPMEGNPCGETLVGTCVVEIRRDSMDTLEGTPELVPLDGTWRGPPGWDPVEVSHWRAPWRGPLVGSPWK